MKTVNDFKDYQIIDMADGMKLETWNNLKLLRPDPQIIWNEKRDEKLWYDVDAVYKRSNTGGGCWDIKNNKIPSSWQVKYQDMIFNLKLMGFKHTGLFPEQAYNWNLIRNKIREAKREVKVLNLFAYTGAASIAALMENANVVHVDASRGMIDWAKENVKSNHLEDRNIRFLVDDVVKRINMSEKTEVEISDLHIYVELALDSVAPAVAKQYRDYRNFKKTAADMMQSIWPFCSAWKAREYLS